VSRGGQVLILINTSSFLEEWRTLKLAGEIIQIL
jgi:hypothetical protein